MNRNRRVPFPGCYRGRVLLAQGANRRTRPGLPARHQRQQQCSTSVSTPLRRLSGQRRRRSAWKPGQKGPRRFGPGIRARPVSIASGNPVSPSQQTINTSLRPRLASSGATRWPQTSPLSAAWTQIPSTCLTALGIDSDHDVGVAVHRPGSGPGPSPPQRPERSPGRTPPKAGPAIE